jgi:23S rRNA G2069 N7-methylase RlmK/C1962 C5-methylase RlmI
MKDVLEIQRDHLKLINHSLRLLKPGGKLFFNVNFRKFKLDEEGIVGAASVKEITKQTLPQDYRKKGLHRSWWIERGEGDAVPAEITKFYE